MEVGYGVKSRKATLEQFFESKQKNGKPIWLEHENEICFLVE